jgi:hypothetical protein
VPSCAPIVFKERLAVKSVFLRFAIHSVSVGLVRPSHDHAVRESGRQARTFYGGNKQDGKKQETRGQKAKREEGKRLEGGERYRRHKGRGKNAVSN